MYDSSSESLNVRGKFILVFYSYLAFFKKKLKYILIIRLTTGNTFHIILRYLTENVFHLISFPVCTKVQHSKSSLMSVLVLKNYFPNIFPSNISHKIHSQAQVKATSITSQCGSILFFNFQLSYQNLNERLEQILFPPSNLLEQRLLFFL